MILFVLFWLEVLTWSYCDDVILLCFLGTDCLDCVSILITLCTCKELLLWCDINTSVLLFWAFCIGWEKWGIETHLQADEPRNCHDHVCRDMNNHFSPVWCKHHIPNMIKTTVLMFGCYNRTLHHLNPNKMHFWKTKCTDAVKLVICVCLWVGGLKEILVIFLFFLLLLRLQWKHEVKLI